MLALVRGEPGKVDVQLVAGHRVNRRDTASKRYASRFANNLRRRLLKDATPDTGCGLKLIERAAFLRLPYFDHMHRYIPALIQRHNGRMIVHRSTIGRARPESRNTATSTARWSAFLT